MTLLSPFPLDPPSEKLADLILQMRHADLLTACTRLTPFTRPGHPLLGCVRLDFAPQSLTLSGSNLEITARIQVPARCSGVAHLRLPLDRLLKWLSLPSPCRVLELRLYGSRLTLCRGDLSAELGVSLEVEDALEPDASCKSDPGGCPPQIRLPATALRSLLERTLPAAMTQEPTYSRSASHPFLGVALEFSGATLCLSATDGSRLARCEAALESPPEAALEGAPTPQPWSNRLHAADLLALLKILPKKGDESVALEWGLRPGRVQFNLGDHTQLTLCELSPRSWHEAPLMGAPAVETVTLEAGGLLTALKVLALSKRPKTKKLGLSLEGGELRVYPESTATPQRGGSALMKVSCTDLLKVLASLSGPVTLERTAVDGRGHGTLRAKDGHGFMGVVSYQH